MRGFSRRSTVEDAWNWIDQQSIHVPAEALDTVSAGGRVLAVVAQGDDFDQAFAAAYSGLNQVQFDGITYRRDIGHQVRSSG